MMRRRTRQKQGLSDLEGRAGTDSDVGREADLERVTGKGVGVWLFVRISKRQ
jgi:hypothetical protein